MVESLETIESPETIVSTLESLIDSRCMLSVSPPGVKDFFTSFILRIEGNSLYIDQVMPLAGNELFKPGQNLNIRISHKSISYRFTSEYIRYSIDDSGFHCHQICLPTRIDYLEKRSGFRIQLKLAESQPIRIAIPPEEFCEATLENISQSGACIRIRGNHIPLETCNVIDCNIQIAQSSPLACKAVIKHYQYSTKTDITKAGVEFCQLSFPAEKQLHKLLMKLQRHNIRTDMTL